jgi:hypothetical protein
VELGTQALSCEVAYKKNGRKAGTYYLVDKEWRYKSAQSGISLGDGPQDKGLFTLGNIVLVGALVLGVIIMWPYFTFNQSPN